MYISKFSTQVLRFVIGQTQAVFWKCHGINLSRMIRLSGYGDDSQLNNDSTYDFVTL